MLQDRMQQPEFSRNQPHAAQSHYSLIGRIRPFFSDLRPLSFVLRRFSFPARLVTIELRQRLPLVSTLLALAWYLIAPGEVPAVLVFALAGMLLVAWLWARAMAREVVARRRLIYA